MLRGLALAFAISILASPVYGQRGWSVEDGVITLHGSFTRLAGIEVQSLTPTLGRAGYEAAPGVILPNQSHAPFAFGTASFLSDSPTQVSYGVLDEENAINVEGKTATAVTYSGTDPRADLFGVLGGQRVIGTIAVAVDGNPPAIFPVLPEPATGLMAVFGFAGLLSLRRHQARLDFDAN